MPGNEHDESLGDDDFFEQIIMQVPTSYNGNVSDVAGSTVPISMMMMMNMNDVIVGDDGDCNVACSSANSMFHERDRPAPMMPSTFPVFGQLQTQQFRPNSGSTSQLQEPFHNQATSGEAATAPPPTAVRPRVRARRGQATDPHSIAERLRRERIAERIKALQDLVPSCNKADRAAMLDEIVEYVKFLRLQVKVLSMSRLGGASAVAQLVADVPPSSSEGEGQPVWEKWSSDGTEKHVAELMEEDIGAAMQFLQSKALCIMRISLASTIFQTNQPEVPPVVMPEKNTSS